ncbi:MAG: aspartate kinase [Firmicutes bacterium]|nr:aspartate kinase [Bacillota bacterium]
MSILVQKYGGSSVASPEKIRAVARRIARAKEHHEQVVVVVSAMGKTTDELLGLARQLSKEPSPRELDMLIATGEQQSSALLVMALLEIGCPAISLTGAQSGIVSSGVHTKAEILDIDPTRVVQELDRGKVVVVAGFQGVNGNNDITTLGRGGSDISAVALAVTLGAPVCEIYTDVEGVYTADPRLVPRARLLGEISYEEMQELANLGAKVLHPRSIEFAQKFNIVLHVRSSFGQAGGTLVKGAGDLEKKRVVSGVACDLDTAKAVVLGVPDEPGVAQRVFLALAEANINIDMIIQSMMRKDRNDIAFTVEEGDLPRVIEIMDRVAAELGAEGVAHDANVAKISIVGAGMISHPGTAATMFGALGDAGINIEMISTSEIKISCLIQEADAKRAVEAIHERFHLDS